MGDHNIKLNKNVGEPDVVYLSIEGRLETDEAVTAVEEFAQTLERADEGFYFINDLSEYNPVSQDAVDTIERGKEAIVEHGVEAVVRVTGGSATAKLQFEQVGDEYQYKRANAETIEEAEAALEELNG